MRRFLCENMLLKLLGRKWALILFTLKIKSISNLDNYSNDLLATCVNIGGTKTLRLRRGSKCFMAIRMSAFFLRSLRFASRSLA